jgi:hypothetical protein
MIVCITKVIITNLLLTIMNQSDKILKSGVIL